MCAVGGGWDREDVCRGGIRRERCVWWEEVGTGRVCVGVNEEGRMCVVGGGKERKGVCRGETRRGRYACWEEVGTGRVCVGGCTLSITLAKFPSS